MASVPISPSSALSRRGRAAPAGRRHPLGVAPPPPALGIEDSKSTVGFIAVRFGVSKPAASVVASTAAGFSAPTVAQFGCTPVDVAMVQNSTTFHYIGGGDAFRKILLAMAYMSCTVVATYPSSHICAVQARSAGRLAAWQLVGPDSFESYPAPMAVQGTSHRRGHGRVRDHDTVKSCLQVMETDAEAARRTLGITMGAARLPCCRNPLLASQGIVV